MINTQHYSDPYNDGGRREDGGQGTGTPHKKDTTGNDSPEGDTH